MRRKGTPFTALIKTALATEDTESAEGKNLERKGHEGIQRKVN
jgi:hypothetical protein